MTEASPASRSTFLQAHPASSSLSRDFRLKAGLQVHPDGTVKVEFHLQGPLEKLRIPAFQCLAGEGQDGLWRHSCFELFLGSAGSSAYEEFNFSPSGAWASYAFVDYREPATHAASRAIRQLNCNSENQHLHLLAVLAPITPSPPHSADRKQVLEFALSAVLEDDSGELSYWAPQHLNPMPDFHLRNAFSPFPLDFAHATNSP